MKKIILITILFLNLPFYADDRRSILTNCLEKNDQQINQYSSDRAIAAALKCMNTFVSEVDKEDQRKVIAQNLNLDALLGFTNPYLYNSYGRQSTNLGIAGYNNIASLLDSYYFLPPSIKLPGIISQATEDDGDGNVFYGSFKGERETAIGVGYGITLSSGSRLQFNAGKNGDATGAGATISF